MFYYSTFFAATIKCFEAIKLQSQISLLPNLIASQFPSIYGGKTNSFPVYPGFISHPENASL